MHIDWRCNSWLPVCYISPKVKSLIQNCISFLCSFHIFVNLWYWNQYIVFVAKYHTCQQYYETTNCSVFKICKLQFTRTKFDSPTDFRIWWWWLESHCLPKNDERGMRIKNDVRSRFTHWQFTWYFDSTVTYQLVDCIFSKWSVSVLSFWLIFSPNNETVSLELIGFNDHLNMRWCICSTVLQY